MGGQYDDGVSTTGTAPDEAKVMLTGRAARWAIEQAQAEHRSPGEVIEEALSIRWGRHLGDAYRRVWDTSPALNETETAELVDVEVYQPRQAARRGE